MLPFFFFKKRNKLYADFHKRAFITVLDLALIILLITPFTGIIKEKIYSKETLDEFPKVIEYAKKLQEEASPPANALIDPYVSEFFKEQRIFDKLIKEQLLYLCIWATITLATWIKFRSTVFGKIFNMRIVDEQTLESASHLQLFIRFVGLFIAVIPVFLGVLWIVIDKKNQGWHDKLAGVVVINIKEKEKLNAQQP